MVIVADAAVPANSTPQNAKDWPPFRLFAYDRGLADGIRTDAGGRSDRRCDAVCAEPEVSAHLTWRHAVDADALRSEFLCKGLAQVHHGGLGDAVIDRASVGLEERVDRGDVYS